MSRRGQASVEAVALIGAVGALVGAIAFGGGLGWLPGLIARAFDDDPEPSPAALAYLDRAVARSGPGPALGDAVLRLTPAVGADRARGLAAERLVRRYASAPLGRREALADPSWALAQPSLDGVGPPGSGIWAEQAERAPAAARIVTRADEEAWRRRQRPSTAERVVGLGAAVAVGVAGAVSPELGAAATLAGAAAEAAEGAPRGLPPGSRADDALVCRFLWVRDTAAPGWAASHPVDAARLPLGERIPAVELTVVRAGRVLARALVRSDATRC